MNSADGQHRCLGRRDVLVIFSAIAAWPILARAQPALPVVGILFPGAATFRLPKPFLDGLGEYGFVVGESVAIEYRYGEGHYDRMPALAADLVARKVAVIVGLAAQGVLPAKAATSTIPVVFITGGDPLRLGFVSSVNRPEGNVTGATFMGGLSTTKQFQLLHEMVPAAGTVALLSNPEAAFATGEQQSARGAAQALGLALRTIEANNEGSLVAGFAQLAAERVGGLVVDADVYFFSVRDRIVGLAAQHAIPTLYSLRGRGYPAEIARKSVQMQIHQVEALIDQHLRAIFAIYATEAVKDGSASPLILRPAIWGIGIDLPRAIEWLKKRAPIANLLNRFRRRA